VDEFHTFNRCLDGAMAFAVTEHARKCAQSSAEEGTARLGSFAHELRNRLAAATMSFDLLKRGRVGIDGSTGQVLGRSLRGLHALIDLSLAEVRLESSVQRRQRVGISKLVEEVGLEASIDASARVSHSSSRPASAASTRYAADEAEGLAHEGWPWLRSFDAGASLVLKLDLPGLTEKDVQLTVQQEVLSLTGERQPDAPEGYSVHRQERTPLKFARSFALPCRVDSEKSTAVLKDGVMTITLPKTPDAQPRQIRIKAQ
jgi:HSP20 family protein